MLTVLKLTPTHAVVEVSGANATETIQLGVDLLFGNQIAVAPRADIRSIRWSVPTGNATITRNAVLLWSVTESNEFKFNGFADTRENASDLVIAIPAGGGTVVVELRKIGGYGDTQHRNAQQGESHS